MKTCPICHWRADYDARRCHGCGSRFAWNGAMIANRLPIVILALAVAGVLVLSGAALYCRLF